MRNIKTTSGGFGGNRSQSSFRNKPGHRSFGPNRNSNRRQRPESKLDIHSIIQKATKATNEPKEEVVITHTFEDFGLSEGVKKNLRHKGYKVPSPIQDQAIKPIMAGNDLIGLANTGTGKTAAFLLPMIEKVFADKSQRVLIIAPTRELALQIESELRGFSYGMRIFYTSVVGGMDMGRQIKGLKMNPEFVIGTPGRIKDMADRGHIDFRQFNNIILDEVDRMLDMGFVNEITSFLKQLPAQKQSLYFSATMSPKIRNLIDTFSNDPVVVRVKSQETSANVHQEVVQVGGETKIGKLKQILAGPGMERVLIFSETKRGVEKLTDDLVKNGFSADSIHGDKKQSQRKRALDNFKTSRVNILVATDVAARGLDIKEVTHVINYTLPQTYEDYVHRIGRTGRGNAVGKALTFAE